LRKLVAQTLQQIGNVLKTQLRIFTMKKSILTIAIATGVFTLAFSGQAKALSLCRSCLAGPCCGVWLNGIEWNGWSLNDGHNGVRLKDVVLPGTSMQATKLEGMELQSLKVEGGQLVGAGRVAAE
jgi:hypothetical protein